MGTSSRRLLTVANLPHWGFEKTKPESGKGLFCGSWRPRDRRWLGRREVSANMN
jgi:hypothetical protein